MALDLDCLVNILEVILYRTVVSVEGRRLHNQNLRRGAGAMPCHLHSCTCVRREMHVCTSSHQVESLAIYTHTKLQQVASRVTLFGKAQLEANRSTRLEVFHA